jgi:hypothetical protein
VSFEEIKREVEEFTGYELRWDHVPVVISHGDRKVEFWCANEPAGYPGFTGYHAKTPQGWIGGEWQDAASAALEYVCTGVLPDPDGTLPVRRVDREYNQWQ